jgi:hypothetical protein
MYVIYTFTHLYDIRPHIVSRLEDGINSHLYPRGRSGETFLNDNTLQYILTMPVLLTPFHSEKYTNRNTANKHNASDHFIGPILSNPSALCCSKTLLLQIVFMYHYTYLIS